MTSRRAGARFIAVAIASHLVIAGRAQSPAGDVLVPASAYRPPVALIVAPADTAAPLADALQLQVNGIASELDTAGGDRGAASTPESRVREILDRIVMLRNDGRFPITIVIGEGSAAPMAAVAARVGRADAFVAVDPRDAAADIARLIVPVFNTTIAGARGGKAIADFIRGVAPLGLRGSRSSRSDGPRRSPRAFALATFGGAMVGIEFAQPQKRGREIWGALVPWGRVWMPGADEATTLTTSMPMRIGSVTVPAGDHTFYLDPRADRVQLLVSRDVGQFHTVFDSQLVMGRADMTLAHRADSVEGMTFALESRGDEGVIKLMWDDREYSVPIVVAK